jgi:FkbM family methyltransferase
LDNRVTEVWLRKGKQAMVLSPKHLVYSPEMAELFDLYFSPLRPEMREGLEVLDYSRPGILQTYRSSGLQFEMASFPEEEEAIEEYFRWYRPKAGDLVFDMGAHCGVSTYHLAKLVGPEGKVVAFEPDPVNFQILKRNMERHGLSNVVAENIAIAGTSGQLGFNSEGTIGSSLVSLMQRETVGSTVMVEALTLADAFARWGVPAFCKIDIEGAEVDVLAQSAEVLQRHRTFFALDTNHPKSNGEMTNGDVEAMFRSYGYDVASEANPLLTTWARPK